MHEFPKTNHATFLYPTACLPLPFSMQWWGVYAVVVTTCGWCVANKKLGTYMQRTPPPMYKKQKKTQKGNKKKGKEQRGAWFRTHELRLNKSKHKKETKKKRKEQRGAWFRIHEL